MTQEKVNGIGWHMVKQVTYSADTISRLTNIEIQCIIDQVTSAQVGMTELKAVNTVHDQESKSTEISASDIEASPNNTTRISSHEVTTSSNYSSVDKISGKVLCNEDAITSKSLPE
ncbi:10986_t:CDS:1, partial [Acaulospora morrowiae]